MASSCLTLMEATGIQAYIFSSNRLQENIGASEQVYRSTTLWAFKALEAIGLTHNIEKSTSVHWNYKNEKNAGNTEYQAEFIYAGGGKALILFKDGKPDAIKFTKELTTSILRNAPGLPLAVQHIEFDWESDKLADKHKALQRKLASHKQSRMNSMPRLGLGVTAACESTSLVAVRSTDGEVNIEGTPVKLKLKDEEKTRFVSRETEYKLGWRDAARDHLNNQLGKDVVKQGFDFPSDIDKLGRQMGEESYVAVVHADGNNMGKHFDAIGDRAKSNREYITFYREFSQNVLKVSLRALQTVLKRVLDLIPPKLEKDEVYYKVANKIPLAENHWFPVRPLVFGGDDVTFLCNAQLGVAMAAEYLKEFEEQTETIIGKRLFACAGVAMVKMHYPFSRAYDLSESLCNSAKTFIRKEKNNKDASALDWHFATSGLSGSLQAIRQREYTTPDGQLYLRPLALQKAVTDQTGRYWLEGIQQVLHEFQAEEKDNGKWAKHRNKLIGLRVALREGLQAVEKYRCDYELPNLPELLPGKNATDTGWSGNQCYYFDAIEMLDHHVSLEKKGDEA
ncbi:MAG: hypothetical protein DWQ05_16790 [Calditrichaeota bacterium]|nr:MAG: hypothetical protein DWQ05_16790 [Calditrichota bacterium]